MHSIRPRFQSATSPAVRLRVIQLFPHQARRPDCHSRDQEVSCQFEQSHRSGQSRVQCLRFPSTLANEIIIIFGPLPSEASAPPFTMLHSIIAEPSAPPIQDYLPPPSLRDLSHPTSPSTPLFFHIVANFTPCEACIQPFSAESLAPTAFLSLGCRSSAWHTRGENVDVVAIVPLFEASITWSSDWTGRAAASEADGPYRRVRRRGSTRKSWC